MNVYLLETKQKNAWAIQYRRSFKDPETGKIVRSNADEIEKFCSNFGYDASVYRNNNGSIAVYCHAPQGLTILSDRDYVIRTERNTIEVRSYEGIGCEFRMVDNPATEYTVEVSWDPAKVLIPTKYLGGKYNELDTVLAVLKAKQRELGFKDDFMKYAEHTLSNQMPMLPIQNSDLQRAVSFKSDKCTLRCWRSK